MLKKPLRLQVRVIIKRLKISRKGSSIRVIRSSVLDFLAWPYAFECFIRDENDSHVVLALASIWFLPFSLFYPSRACESQVRALNRQHILPVIDFPLWPFHPLRGCRLRIQNLRLVDVVVSINTRQRRVIMQPTPLTAGYLTPLPARLLCVPLLCRALVAALHFAGVLL